MPPIAPSYLPGTEEPRNSVDDIAYSLADASEPEVPARRPGFGEALRERWTRARDNRMRWGDFDMDPVSGLTGGTMAGTAVLAAFTGGASRVLFGSNPVEIPLDALLSTGVCWGAPGMWGLALKYGGYDEAAARVARAIVLPSELYFSLVGRLSRAVG